MEKLSNSMRESIVELSATLGCDEMFVQGAGGNISWKEDGVLWIKASGKWFANALVEDIFVPIDLCLLHQAILENSFDARLVTRNAVCSLRPSMETMLHALFPHRVVLHVHAIESLAWSIRDDFHNEITSMLPNFIRWAWIPYHTPGMALAKAVYNAFGQSEYPDVLFLKNHGIVIGGSNAADVFCLLKMIESSLAIKPKGFSPEIVGSGSLSTLVGETFHFLDDLEVQQLVFDDYLFARLIDTWPIFPDQVVFLGGHANIFDSKEEFMRAMLTANSMEVAFIKTCGVFVRNNIAMSKKAQLRAYHAVMSRQSTDYSIGVLNATEIAELLGCDAEAYRSLLNK